ncbi:MAG TPA: glycosyltransferase family 39 protein [Thermoanaerobaculia bacterium]
MKRQLREALPFIAFAIAKLAFHTLTNGNYGFHRDELATLDDARHLAWGFVAYPPLTPFLGRLELIVFGDSVAGFRFLAAAAQSVAIVLTALIAKHLGGNRAAQWIAAIAVAIAPLSLAASSLFQYVSFDYLWWVLIAYFIVRLVESNDPRWWAAIGTTIGLGVMTKYTIAFYVAGLVVGVLLSPLRNHLRSRWLWVGVAISIAIVVPHFIWQARNGFITLEFLKTIHARDIRIGRTTNFLTDQLWIATSAVTVPLWILGLAALFRHPRFRILGWMAVVPFVLFLAARGRGYYLSPVYPMLLAAGAVELTRWLDGRGAVARRVAFSAMAILLIAGSSMMLVLLPITPIESPLGRFAMKANSDLREEAGWPEMTAEVARIWASLPASERARTAIYCSNYGEAGAIDLYGPRYGLPPAISGVNSFWARGYGNPPPETLIILGSHRERLEGRFTSVTLAGRIPNPHRLDNEESEHADIFVCRGLTTPWPELWKHARSFG